MKKTMMITVLTILMGLSANAQGGKFLVGAGAGFAIEGETPSVFATGVYRFTEQWEAAAGITYFIPKNLGDSNVTTVSLGFDTDAHYVFANYFYGLAGLHISKTSMSYDLPEGLNDTNLENTSNTITNTGFNIGAGARYPFSDNLYGFGEAKYVIYDGGGNVNIGAGVLFSF